ncbi:hypothetical protein AB0L63_16555 [Nocardia sp. NPDC051990]|uniref:hypothetical protein n=1 Tax=Nocardia sp. NPDC051990 TaxID=3155285 RepID=UPI00343828F8
MTVVPKICSVIVRGRHTDEALRVLPALVTGATATVNDVDVALAPGSAMPPVVVAGNGTRTAAGGRIRRWLDNPAADLDQLAVDFNELRSLAA